MTVGRSSDSRMAPIVSASESSAPDALTLTQALAGSSAAALAAARRVATSSSLPRPTNLAWSNRRCGLCGASKRVSASYPTIRFEPRSRIGWKTGQ